MYVPFAKIKKHYGVSSGTFQRWANEGKIDSTRTPRKHRLFKLPDVTSSEKTEKDFGDAEGDVVVYIRVSSAKQRDDFERKRT